ncbi:MAG: hypothetical protein LBQ51_02295 [Desulfovibrio sp.]|jgi:hypothetical protein|nr:hypothetical protein [Desulfovibrio sp.]
MDMFGIAYSRAGRLTASCIWRNGVIVMRMPRSVLFFDDVCVKELFIPMSVILDWHFTTCGTKRNLNVPDLERDDEVSLYIPKWLARKEKLIID